MGRLQHYMYLILQPQHSPSDYELEMIPLDQSLYCLDFLLENQLRYSKIISLSMGRIINDKTSDNLIILELLKNTCIWYHCETKLVKAEIY